MAARTAPSGPPKRRRGRPQVHDEAWTKVSVVLFDRQIQRLDRLRRNVRGVSSKQATRASLIRSLVDGLLTSGVEIGADTSEASLRDQIASSLRSLKRPRRRPLI